MFDGFVAVFSPVSLRILLKITDSVIFLSVSYTVKSSEKICCEISLKITKNVDELQCKIKICYIKSNVIETRFKLTHSGKLTSSNICNDDVYDVKSSLVIHIRALIIIDPTSRYV